MCFFLSLRNVGSTKIWLFQTWLFAISTRKEALFCAVLHPFALSCALLRTCVCALLCSFALICAHLRIFTSDRVENDHVWELQSKEETTLPALHKKTVTFLYRFAWGFGIENGGDFWQVFNGLHFSRKKAQQFLTNKIRGKFGAKFGAKFRTKVRKNRGTFVLQL